MEKINLSGIFQEYVTKYGVIGFTITSLFFNRDKAMDMRIVFNGGDLSKFNPDNATESLKKHIYCIVGETKSFVRDGKIEVYIELVGY
jgi:hypothetical protein